MPAIKLQKFLGKAPRVAPELLPDTAAQVATNVKLYSGDLIPYPAPVIALWGNNGLTGARAKTLYALRNPQTNDLEWMVWTTDVDIATPAGTDNVDEQRFYYTGDGKPKVSTYALATSGAPPYPTDSYDLGLPLPTATPVATALSFEELEVRTYERDAGGVMTIRTQVPHNLKSGAFITLSGYTERNFSYTQTGTTLVVDFGIRLHNTVVGARVLLRFVSGDAVDNIYTITETTTNTFTVLATESINTSGNGRWDISSLNASSVEITVVDPERFSFNNPGYQVSTSSGTAGRVNLSGATQARSYLYTWYTPWEEESIGSLPSDPKYIKEGQVVNVTNLPTAPPAGNNFIRGIRLYRTLSTVADTEYLRLATLWFPVPVTTVTSTRVVYTSEPHNLSVGSYFKISTGVVGARVTDVYDDYSFRYTGGTGSGGSGGVLYHDVSETPGTSTPQYWGDSGLFGFLDDFAVESLLNALVTDEYDPPPGDLKGLTLFNNNILVGFAGNELYFSEPGQYHAWPRSYKQELPYNIVGLAVFSGYLLVATESYPYLVSGNDPAVLSVTRVDARYPCLSKSSIANMGFGVMYATHDGLALYSTTTGPQLATRLLYNSDTWKADLNPATLLGTAYKDTYLAWHSGGGLSFERDERVGGYFVDLETPQQPDATWYDPSTNSLYYTSGTTGDVYEWDNLSQPAQPYEWKSKVIVSPNPINIGAAQVDADYDTDSPVWDTVTDNWVASQEQWNADGGILFKFWVDGELVAERPLVSREAFRLPAGYRSDTFEVGVSGSVRLRTIRLAETPTGLRDV